MMFLVHFSPQPLVYPQWILLGGRCLEICLNVRIVSHSEYTESNSRPQLFPLLTDIRSSFAFSSLPWGILTGHIWIVATQITTQVCSSRKRRSQVVRGKTPTLLSKKGREDFSESDISKPTCQNQLTRNTEEHVFRSWCWVKAVFRGLPKEKER